LLADDTLILCGANLDHLRHLCCLFLCFEAALGLKINLASLNWLLWPVGNVEHVEKVASILGYGISSLPVKYLGLPLGASYKAKHI
jgi:hypothetical protein